MQRRELLTAALLGTERRPVSAPDPDADPAVVILDQAVRSSVATRAGMVLLRLPPPPTGPQGGPTWAPPAAQEVMARLLVRPQPDLIDLWLRAAADAGLGLAPQHWAAMATYASRNAQISRPLLAAALGPAGLWFVRQNPEWAKLAGALREPSPTTERVASGAVPDVQPERLLDDPQLIFVASDPWPRSLVEVALMIIGTGRLQWRTTAYATAFGARLPVDHVPVVAAAAQYFAPPDGPPVSRMVREGFVVLDRVLALRVEILQAFGTPPSDPVTAVSDPQEYG